MALWRVTFDGLDLNFEVEGDSEVEALMEAEDRLDVIEVIR